MPVQVPASKQPRTAVLVRVSTKDQHLVEQFRTLRHEAQRRGWRVTRVYRERESTRKERKQLQALMADGLMRRWDALLVLRLDRLGRSLIETYSNVQRLHERGVQVVSVKDGALDTSTASSKLQIAMLCACADYERELIRERTIEGLRRVKRLGSASGRPIGRPRAELDLDALALRHAAGESFTALAAEAGVSERTLRRRLQGRTKPGVDPGTRNPANSGPQDHQPGARSNPVVFAGEDADESPLAEGKE